MTAVLCLPLQAAARGGDHPPGSQDSSNAPRRGPPPQRPGPPLDPPELERRLFGPDREARRRAAWQAMRQQAFGEDVWIRLLEQRHPTREEDEETRYLAAYALTRFGTERCLPHLEALLEDPPKVLVEQEHGRGKALGPAFDYVSEAALAIALLRNQRLQRRLSATLAPLPPVERAERILQMWAEGAAAYHAFRSPDDPERVPTLWRSGLTQRLRDLGAPGAWAMARGLETLESDALRADLCNEFARRFVGNAIDLARRADPDLDAQFRRLSGLPRDEARKTREALERRLLDPEVGEPVRAAVRALIERPVTEAPHHYAMQSIGRLVRAFELSDLEPDLMRGIRGRRFETEEERFVRNVLSDCLRLFASRGSDAALAFLIDERLGADSDIPRERWVPRCVDALVREQERPWNIRFGWILAQCGRNPGNLPYVDPGRIEAVLVRVREIQDEVEDRQRRRVVSVMVIGLERLVANARSAQARD